MYGAVASTTFGASEWIILGVWILAVVFPIAHSIRNKTPIALGISVGLSIVQYALVAYFHGLEFRFYGLLLIPKRLTPVVYYLTLFTAGFLHSMSDDARAW